MDQSIEGSCAHLGAVKLNSVGWEHFRDHLDGRKVNQSPVPSRRGDVKNSPVPLSNVVQKQGYAFVSQHHKLNLNISIVVRDRASALQNSFHASGYTRHHTCARQRPNKVVVMIARKRVASPARQSRNQRDSDLHPVVHQSLGFPLRPLCSPHPSFFRKLLSSMLSLS